QQFELKHDFRGARRRHCYRNALFRNRSQTIKGRFSPWNDAQMPSAVSSTRSIGANSCLTPKIVQVLVLSNRTILTLSCRHPCSVRREGRRHTAFLPYLRKAQLFGVKEAS